MKQTKNKANRKIFFAVGILAAFIAVFAFIYATFGAKPVTGSKSITIEVLTQNGESAVYPLHTDAEYLRQAMEEAEGLTFSGSESQFGLMVDTVNDVRADYTLDHAYWSFLVNGEYCNYGIDTQPVMDGDAFSIVYTPVQ